MSSRGAASPAQPCLLALPPMLPAAVPAFAWPHAACPGPPLACCSRAVALPCREGTADVQRLKLGLFFTRKPLLSAHLLSGATSSPAFLNCCQAVFAGGWSLTFIRIFMEKQWLFLSSNEEEPCQGSRVRCTWT